MLEVEQASVDFEAQARLSQIKEQLGLGTSTGPAAVSAEAGRSASPTEGEAPA